MNEIERKYFRDYYRVHKHLWKNKLQIRRKEYYTRLKQDSIKYRNFIIKQNKNAVRRLRALRQVVLLKLGNKCICCGFSDQRALQIDHVHGGGIPKGEHPMKYLKRVYTEINLGSDDYQLLCANCNWIKRYENKECKGWDAYQ